MTARHFLAISAAALGLQLGVAQAQPQPMPQPPAQSQAQPRGPQNAGPQLAPPQARPAPQQAAPQGHPGPQRAAPQPPQAKGPMAAPEHRFHKGDRLPADFRGRQHVVDNWRAHRLSAPPRGQHWVQVGADYALVRIATGVVVQLVQGR